jgi:hypothetical protein
MSFLMVLCNIMVCHVRGTWFPPCRRQCEVSDGLARLYGETDCHIRCRVGWKGVHPWQCL